MSSIRIEGAPGSFGSRFKVFLNGNELDCVKGVQLWLDNGNPADVTLQLEIDDIAVDGEVRDIP
jgi:hypothetical protein